VNQSLRCDEVGIPNLKFFYSELWKLIIMRELENKETTVTVSKSLINLFALILILVLFFFIIWIIGKNIGLLKFLIAISVFLIWVADVAFKGIVGMSADSSGVDLAFGALTASLITLLSKLNLSSVNRIEIDIYLLSIMFFVWVLSLVLSAIADDSHKLSLNLIEITNKYMDRQVARAASYFIGFANFVLFVVQTIFLEK